MLSWWGTFTLTVWHAIPFLSILILSWLLFWSDFLYLWCFLVPLWIFCPYGYLFLYDHVVHCLGSINYMFWVSDMLLICFLSYVFDFFTSSFCLMMTHLYLSYVSVFYALICTRTISAFRKKRQWWVLCATEGSVTHKFEHILSGTC